MIRISRNDNISFKTSSGKKNILEDLRVLSNRRDITEMLSNARAIFIEIRKRKERFSTKAIETTEDFEYEIRYQEKGTIYQQEREHESERKEKEKNRKKYLD